MACHDPRAKSHYIFQSAARASTNHSIHILFDCQFLDHFVFMLRIFFSAFSTYRRLFLRMSISLFCDSLRFYCVFFFRCCDFLSLPSLLLNRCVFIAVLAVWVCVSVSKLLKRRWYRQHHTTNFRFRTCTATPYTNILVVWSLLSFAFRLFRVLLHLFTRNGTIASSTATIIVVYVNVDVNAYWTTLNFHLFSLSFVLLLRCKLFLRLWTTQLFAVLML